MGSVFSTLPVGKPLLTGSALGGDKFRDICDMETSELGLPVVTLCLANRTHNHLITRSHRLAALDSSWMFNSSLQFLRRKLNAHCVWTQSINPRLCHVFTHFASSVSINMQASQEDNYKRQSNVRFVRHLLKSQKETRSRICLHLIISTPLQNYKLT